MMDFKIDVAAREQKPSVAIASEKLDGIVELVLANLDEAHVEHGSPEPYDSGFKIDLDECLWGRAAEHHQNGDPSGGAVFIDASGRLGYHCFHTWCAEHYHWTECRAELERRAGHQLKFGEPVEMPLTEAMQQRIAQAVEEKKQREQAQQPIEPPEPVTEYAMTQAEIEAEFEKPYPVFRLVEQGGPTWDDDIMYGIAGEIIRKMAEYNEAHPAGMYLDLLVSIGSIIGRNAYFRVSSTAHYTNEFMARVGQTSDSRKGTGRDAVDELLKFVDPKWYVERVKNGFGSAQAIICEIKDAVEQQVFSKKSAGFKSINVPGITDKRLCVRENELARIFLLAGMKDSLTDVVLRDGWDGKALHNIVKGKGSDGFSNSASCQFPHLSLSGDTTKSELFAKMPTGADENGFGNRFLYCYVYRTKKCPLGGPEIDWAEIVVRLFEIIKFAQAQKYVPLSKAAEKMWSRMYLDLESNRPLGLAGKMTARGPAHVRRLALILALLDMSPVVESRHLQAARRLWDYCQESAEYIFSGCTQDQRKILNFVGARQGVTAAQVREELFQRHQKASWVQAQLSELVRRGNLMQAGEQFKKAA
jgi:hypothetical protein